MQYRPEIDGLRALAVVPVILFHAGFDLFKGGFVGVDIFFVISGYLITTIIIEDINDGKFTLKSFYERRARRILPALFLVLFFSSIFSWLWLAPDDMKDFSQSLVSTVLFFSNVLFWRESGYFETASELKPLIHTWSLSLEEQFYLFFPILCVFALRYFKKYLSLLIAVGLLVSLLLSILFTSKYTTASFFLLPTRIWELLAGSLVAIYLMNPVSLKLSNRQRDAAGFLGILLIALSVVLFDESLKFPGFYAILPTLGAVLIILFAREDNFVGSFLGNRIFVFIGLISYSAYLWHQPLFAFARHRFEEDLSHNVFISLSLLSLLIGYLSWRFIERPFRNRAKTSSKMIVIFSVAGTSLAVAIGSYGIYTNGFENRLPFEVRRSLDNDPGIYIEPCKRRTDADYAHVSVCEFGDLGADKTIILYGDSHADVLLKPLSVLFSQLAIKGLNVSFSGCEIIPGLVDMRRPLERQIKCEKEFDEFLEVVSEENADVIISSRWTFSLYPIKDAIEDMPYKNSEGGVEKVAYRKYAAHQDGNLLFDGDTKKKAIDSFVQKLLRTNKRIFFVYPIPEIAWDIKRFNWRYYLNERHIVEEISTPADDYTKRNSFVIKEFDKFKGNENFIPIRPYNVFCDTFIKDRCAAQIDSKPLYFDDDHLSYEGARILIESFKHSF